MLKERLLAFLIHLSASIITAVALFLLLISTWFPGALFAATGGIDGLTIVLAVDIVLGPVLTFVAYNTKKTKAHLTRDLGIIVSIQVSCLVAGVFIVYQARPLALVHVYDTFYVVNNTALKAVEIDPTVLDKFEASSPKFLYVSAGNNPVSFKISQISDSLNQLKPKYLQTEKYQNLHQHQNKIDTILNHDKKAQKGNCILQNISSPYKEGTICFNPDTFELTDFTEGESMSELDDITISIEHKNNIKIPHN